MIFHSFIVVTIWPQLLLLLPHCFVLYKTQSTEHNPALHHNNHGQRSRTFNLILHVHKVIENSLVDLFLAPLLPNWIPLAGVLVCFILVSTYFDTALAINYRNGRVSYDGNWMSILGAYRRTGR